MNYDVIIVGFGKGGKTIAGDLVKAGKKVALIEENEKMYGGTCINVGCIPSKFLVQKSKFAKFFENKNEYFTKAMQEKDAFIAALRAKNYEKVASNTEVILGKAKFKSANEIEVGGQILSAENILINTGSKPVIPDFKGISEVKNIFTSEELLSLKTLPEHLVILGGGYIGLEFASIFSKFGSRVSVIIRGDKFLPKEDDDVANTIKSVLEANGVEIILNAKINEMSQDGENVLINLGSNSIKADAVLLATGRKANTSELNLAAAGVKIDERGNIITNKHRQTSVNHIYAMGDVVGKGQFTYLSLDDYRIVKSALLENGSYDENARGAVPYSVFIDPPFARVGMSENEAKTAGYSIKVAKLPTMAIPKSKILGEQSGFLKVIIDEKTHKILGVHLFCEESHEMINLFKLAIDLNLDYEILRDCIYTHPTMSEAINDLLSML